MKNKFQLGSILKYFILSIFGLGALYPFIWLFLNAFKEQYEIYSNPFGYPIQWMVGNIPAAWQMAKLSNAFINSIFITGVSVIIIVFFSAMASYAISRKMVKKWTYSYFSLGIMIAAHTILIPIFSIFTKMRIVDHSIALILIYISSNIPLAVFILVGFFNSLPFAIEEAATIDGASPFRIFIQIIIPTAKSGLATVATLMFLNCWNDYLFAFVIIRSSHLKTLTQSVMGLQGQYASNIPLLCAGLFIAILPVIMVYVIFQEQVIKGMTAGAVKE